MKLITHLNLNKFVLTHENYEISEQLPQREENRIFVSTQTQTYGNIYPKNLHSKFPNGFS